jgi:hypothetical protein
MTSFKNIHGETITGLKDSDYKKPSPQAFADSNRAWRTDLANRQKVYRIVESYMRAGLDKRSAVLAYGANKLAQELQEANVEAATGDKLIKEILTAGRGPEAPEFKNLFGAMLESL